MTAADTTKAPARPMLRKMVEAGMVDDEITERFAAKHRGHILCSLREIRAVEERKANPDHVNRRGPFEVLYTTSAGTPVYYVGGGHAIHGDHALQAMCFGPDAPRVEPLEVKRPVRVVEPIAVVEEPPPAVVEEEEPQELVVPPLEQGEGVYEWAHRVSRLNGTTLPAMRSPGRRPKMRVVNLRSRMICAIKAARPSLSLTYIGRVFAMDSTCALDALKRAKEGEA